jgi:DNA-binding NarL/FixJ family response regulator
MPRKTPSNHGKAWTPKDQQTLQRLAKGNTPTGLIAHQLGRTEGSVRSHASETHVSLKPTNQSPYNRRKK